MRLKWPRGEGVEAFSSPHPLIESCSLFNIAVDTGTEKKLTPFTVNLDPQVKWNVEEQRTS